MTDKQIAHWLRFAVGLAFGLGIGIDSFVNGRSALWAYGLPAVILLLTIADFTRYVLGKKDEPLGRR